MIECPGCKLPHSLRVNRGEAGGDLPCWTFSGNATFPTFAPSLVVLFGDSRCHSFIREGRIQFLADCTHALAGETVDLPEVE